MVYMFGHAVSSGTAGRSVCNVCCSGACAYGWFPFSTRMLSYTRRGTLQPNSYSVLQVAFSPKSTGTFSCQTFALSTAGGNQVTFTCQGTAVGPQLQLSSRVYSFGNVKVAQISSKVIYLENVCDVPLSFEFLVEQDGVFSLTKRKGVIPPRSMTHTALAFKATVPANYWQRITCLVKVRGRTRRPPFFRTLWRVHCLLRYGKDRCVEDLCPGRPAT